MQNKKHKIIYQFFSLVLLFGVAMSLSHLTYAATATFGTDPSGGTGALDGGVISNDNISSSRTGTFGADPYGGGTGSVDGSHGIANGSSSRTIDSGTTATGLVCPTSLNTLTDFINSLTCLASKSLVPLVFAIALLVFVYGVVKYVIAAKDSHDREEGRMFMIYGIIALFVMVSVWGLVAVLANTFNIGSSFPPRFQ